MPGNKFCRYCNGESDAHATRCWQCGVVFDAEPESNKPMVMVPGAESYIRYAALQFEFTCGCGRHHKIPIFSIESSAPKERRPCCESDEVTNA